VALGRSETIRMVGENSRRPAPFPRGHKWQDGFLANGLE
jgi:hypothetical protein